MPLYDLSYRRLEAPRTSRFERSVALARSSVSLLLSRRTFLLLLALCWVPIIVRAGFELWQQFSHLPGPLAVDEDSFRAFLAQQVLFLPVILVALYTGAGAIASDLSSGALVIYLSKPISRWNYVAGKALPILASLGAITFLPAFALLVLHLSVAPNLDLLTNAPWLPFSIAAYSLVLSLYYSLSVLAVSSLCRSARVAGAGFAALVFGSDVLVRTTLRRAPDYFTLRGASMDASFWFFGGSSAGDAPFASILVMLSVIVISGIILDRRLSSREALL
jgi:ABC-2 type transport system permease protein